MEKIQQNAWKYKKKKEGEKMCHFFKFFYVFSSLLDFFQTFLMIQCTGGGSEKQQITPVCPKWSTVDVPFLNLVL